MCRFEYLLCSRGEEEHGNPPAQDALLLVTTKNPLLSNFRQAISQPLDDPDPPSIRFSSCPIASVIASPFLWSMLEDQKQATNTQAHALHKTPALFHCDIYGIGARVCWFVVFFLQRCFPINQS